MQHKEYNGWTNYETWLASIWIDNDQDSHETAIERAEEALRRNDSDKEWAAQECAAALDSEYDGAAGEALRGSAGLFHDLLNSALSEVHWREIAEHHVETAWDNIGAELTERAGEDRRLG